MTIVRGLWILEGRPELRLAGVRRQKPEGERKVDRWSKAQMKKSGWTWETKRRNKQLKHQNKEKARNEGRKEESVWVSGTTADPSLVFGLAYSTKVFSDWLAGWTWRLLGLEAPLWLWKRGREIRKEAERERESAGTETCSHTDSATESRPLNAPHALIHTCRHTCAILSASL